jgi:serine/threonine protein kinase
MAENNVPVDDLWMFDKHSGGLKGCGALGVSLATTFPTFWQMWAPDVMSISSLMVDCIACELTEQKVYGNGGMALTPQPIFCAMWQVASASLRLSLNQMLWLLQRTAGLAACLSADLQPRWFHDMQEDSEKRNPTLSRLDWKKLVGCVGELAEMWLRQGQLLDFTFDEGAQGNISAQRAFGDSYCLRFPWLGAGAGLDAATHLDASKSLDGSNSISGGGGITALSREMYSAVLPAQQALHMSAGHLGYGDKPAVASLRPWPVDRAARKEAGQLKAAHLADGDGGGGSDLGCGVSASAVHELCMLQQLHYYSALHTLCSGNSNDAALVGETRMQPVCPYVMPVLGIATLPGTFGMPKFSRTESVLGSKNNSEESAASLEVSSVSSPREENEISATSLRYSNEEAGEEVDFLRAITLGSNADSPRGGGGSGGKTASQCFLVAPPVHLSLETLLNYNAKRSSQQPLSPAFALELCRDVFSAVDHLTSAGLVLKWLDPAHIFVSSNGRIMLGGLQGATHAGSGALSCGLPSHITLLEREREKTEREIRKKRHDDRRRHKKRSRGDDADGSSRKRHKSSSSERGNSSGSGGIGAFKLVKGSKVNKPSLPHLPSAAPEIILGGLASVRSSMYSAAAVCVGIFSGKLLFRGADSEQAHLQQIYKTLGTPSKEAPAAAANYFKELPLESLYGGHVVTPDGPQSTRSRAFKSLRATIPSNALAQFSVEDLAAAVRPEAHGQDKLLDEHYSDNGGLLDVLRGCLCLAPHRRFESAAQVLQQRLFASNKPVSSAQRVLELERRRDSRT